VHDFFGGGKEGGVKEVRMVLEKKTQRFKGCAYVEFLSIEAAQKALALVILSFPLSLSLFYYFLLLLFLLSE
jgi:hypothetical protein